MNIAQEFFKNIEVTKSADQNYERIQIAQSDKRFVDIETSKVPELIKFLFKHGIISEDKALFLEELKDTK